MSTRTGKHGRRILMTVDAVGGVWRYAMDLAEALRLHHGTESVFLGFGPKPSPDKIAEAENIGKLIWLDAPLDWMASCAQELNDIPAFIAAVAEWEEVDLLHLNLPSQAARLELRLPVVAVSHSCVVTWFAGVRGERVPQDWRWHHRLNRAGFDRADAVLAPSRSHAEMLEKTYGPIASLAVVLNGSRVHPRPRLKENFVFAAGRWWDEGKNGTALDRAAALAGWPILAAGPCTGPNGQSVSFDHASHVGELNHREAMTLMERAAIFVSPSIYEPFGLAALEAARAGAALVLADIPTYRELWDKAALFADPHDPQAFARWIDRLSRDEPLRSALAANALARSEMLTVEAQAAAVSRIYDRLLDPSRTITAAE